MTDLLSDRGEISVLELNFSPTGEPGILLFFRPLQYDEFTITSGVSFPFPKEEKNRLRTEYEDRIDPVNSTSQSLQRFTTFYDLFRDYGIQVHFLRSSLRVLAGLVAVRESEEKVSDVLTSTSLSVTLLPISY